MAKSKPKIKTVTARVIEQVEYIVETRCPYCKKTNQTDAEEEEPIIETCWKCRKQYKIKIPK